MTHAKHVKQSADDPDVKDTSAARPAEERPRSAWEQLRTDLASRLVPLEAIHRGPEGEGKVLAGVLGAVIRDLIAVADAQDRK